MTDVVCGQNMRKEIETLLEVQLNDDWWRDSAIEEKQLFLTLELAMRVMPVVSDIKALVQELRNTVALVVTTMAHLGPPVGSRSAPEETEGVKLTNGQ